MLTGKPINYFMSPYSYFSLSSKRSKVICARNDKKTRFLWLWCPEISNFFCPENKNFICPGLRLMHGQKSVKWVLWRVCECRCVFRRHSTLVVFKSSAWRAKHATKPARMPSYGSTYCLCHTYSYQNIYRMARNILEHFVIILWFVIPPSATFLQTNTGLLCLAVDSTHTVVGLFRLLVRRSGTNCQMNSEIRHVILTALNISLERSCSVFTTATNALTFLTLCAL